MEIVFRGVAVKKGERAILHDVGGVARPGELLAVMGPSGEITFMRLDKKHVFIEKCPTDWLFISLLVLTGWFNFQQN